MNIHRNIFFFRIFNNVINKCSTLYFCRSYDTTCIVSSNFCSIFNVKTLIRINLNTITFFIVSIQINSPTIIVSIYTTTCSNKYHSRNLSISFSINIYTILSYSIKSRSTRNKVCFNLIEVCDFIISFKRFLCKLNVEFFVFYICFIPNR